MSIFDNPIAAKKLISFRKYVIANDGLIGTKQRGIDINLNNACNLKCRHCFTNSPLNDHITERLSNDTLARISDEAHEQGIFEYDLQGGELLMKPKLLFEALEAIRPERFYLYVTTNGYRLDRDIAKKLKKAKVSRVSVSIDSMEAEVHDDFRGRVGSWQRAIEALEHVKAVGIEPYLNITVGHYNALSDDIENMLKYSKSKGYTTLVNVATPGGLWKNVTEVMVDDKDKEHLINKRKEYGNVLRNLWNPFDPENEKVLGCNTVNRLYITPLGDVLVCPYVHIKIGNIYENSLKEISEEGFRYKAFHDNSQLCLAGEDRDFVKKYLTKYGTTIFKPELASDIFNADDMVNPNDLADKTSTFYSDLRKNSTHFPKVSTL
mgnify:FL=1